jgi:hypothetical protein
MNIKKNKILNIYKKRFISILSLSILLTFISFYSFYSQNESSKLKFITNEAPEIGIVDLIMQTNTEQDEMLLNIINMANSHKVGDDDFLSLKGNISSGRLTPINGFFLQKNFREIFKNETEKYDSISVKIIEQRSKQQDLYTVISNNHDKNDDQTIVNIIEEIFLNIETILEERILERIQATRKEQLTNLFILDSVLGSNFGEIFLLITNKKSEILEKTLQNKGIKDFVTINNRVNRKISSLDELVVSTSEIKYGQIVLLFFIFHMMVFFIFVTLKGLNKRKRRK